MRLNRRSTRGNPTNPAPWCNHAANTPRSAGYARVTPASTWQRALGSALLGHAVLGAAASVLGLAACSRQESGVRGEPAAQAAPAPANATYNLAPHAVAAAAEQVLAATAPDATPAPAGDRAPAAAAPVTGTRAVAADAPARGASAGAPGPGCVKGWSTPERGSPLRSAVLDMMRVRPGERFVVEEMRYFVGPEDAEVLGARGEVERWYVKASTESEPRRRYRWLVRRAAVGSGVDALAPFDSVGYGPATWRRPDAADESLADPFQRPCQGTSPGEKCMGLPREVLGCLAGT